MFIAAYVAGLAVQKGYEEAGSHSAEFAEGWGQMFDLFVFLLFGLFVAKAFGHFTAVHVVYAILSLTVARMLPVAIALGWLFLRRGSIWVPIGLHATFNAILLVLGEAALRGAPHVGRGGWTWYTGSAGWMYRAGLESILGLRRHGGTFELDPCIPASWPEYAIRWRFGRTRYEISVKNPERRCRGIGDAWLDGGAVDPREIALVDDGGTHEVSVVLGDARRQAVAVGG